MFQGWILLAHMLARPALDPTKWSPAELSALRKYFIYFRYPSAAKIFSGACSAIGLSAFLWVPWLVYKGFWIRAILIGLNYFLANGLAVNLNPQLFLRDAVVKKGKQTQLPELLAVESISEKLAQNPEVERA